MRTNILVPVTLLLLSLAGLMPANSVWADDGWRTRSVTVEEVRNPQPPFLVRLTVDHPDHIYRGGEEMHTTVMSERSGYLYLFYRDASGRTSCLFPNCLQRDNQITAWKKVAVPAAQARFRLRVGPPYGREYLKAVVTLRPLAAVEVASLIRGDTTPLDREQVKAVFVELRDQPARWAEHGLAITTVDPNQTVRAPRPSRRV